MGQSFLSAANETAERRDKLAEAIRTHREAKQMTHHKLAHIIGANVQGTRRAERGTYKLTIEQAARLAIALDFSLDAVLLADWPLRKSGRAKGCRKT